MKERRGSTFLKRRGNALKRGKENNFIKERERHLRAGGSDEGVWISNPWRCIDPNTKIEDQVRTKSQKPKNQKRQRKNTDLINDRLPHDLLHPTQRFPDRLPSDLRVLPSGPTSEQLERLRDPPLVREKQRHHLELDLDLGFLRSFDTVAPCQIGKIGFVAVDGG